MLPVSGMTLLERICSQHNISYPDPQFNQPTWLVSLQFKRTDTDLQGPPESRQLQVEQQYASWNTGLLLIPKAVKEIEANGYATVYVDTPEDSAVASPLSGRGGYVGHIRFTRLRYDYPKKRTWDHRNPEDLRILRVFFVELCEQSRICVTAYAEQAVVVAATIISRFLWPNRAPRKDRAV